MARTKYVCVVEPLRITSHSLRMKTSAEQRE